MRFVAGNETPRKAGIETLKKMAKQQADYGEIRMAPVENKTRHVKNTNQKSIASQSCQRHQPDGSNFWRLQTAKRCSLEEKRITLRIMNPYEQLNPALQWLLEHPGISLTLTILWHPWVAIALGFICLQIYKHNEREELKKIMRQFDEERREREKKANPFKT